MKEVAYPVGYSVMPIYKENKVLNFIKKIFKFFRRKHTN